MDIYIYSGQRNISISQSRLSGARAAAALRTLGNIENSAVAIMLRNDLSYFEAMHGARLSGAYAVPVNWHYTGAEVEYILRDANARALIIHADLLPAVQSHIPEHTEVFLVTTPPEIAKAYRVADADCSVPSGYTDWEQWIKQHAPITTPDRLGSIMLYTSGTTGNPKGVRRAALSLQEQQDYYCLIGAIFGLRAGARILMPGPLYHSAPNAYCNIGMQLDCAQWLMPRFDAQALLQLIEAERITHIHMVPTMFVRLLQLPQPVRESYDLSSLECVIHGAAPCPVEIKQRMITWWGPVIREYYGSTEGSLVSIVDSDEWLQYPGTVGRATNGAVIRIYDENGCPVAPGQIGEIYMQQTAAPDFTYFNRDNERREIERDGLITNGDIGYMNEAGYLFLCDRKRDMIISGGVNIYPAEIENVLIQHPAVKDCAVFGVPDEEFGESITAAVELKKKNQNDTVHIEELRQYLQTRLAKYKLPKTIAFYDALPREDSGKIFKRKLRDPYWRNTGRQI